MRSSLTSPISIENSNVAESAVVNASPLIFLSRAGLLDLLQLLSSEIIVPEVVASEIEVRGKSDPTAHAIANTSWLVVTQTPQVPPQIQAWGLGPGESSVLAWAHAHPGSEAIIDDLAGRRCAAALNIPVRGTLGLALIAKQRGRIPSARRVLEQLRQRGMYLSEHTMDEALARVGE
jgi:predicted nucleic acid-binding protein